MRIYKKLRSDVNADWGVNAQLTSRIPANTACSSRDNNTHLINCAGTTYSEQQNILQGQQ